MSKYIYELCGECPSCGEQINQEFEVNNLDKDINYLYGTSKFETIECDSCDDKFDARANMTIEFELE